MHKETSNRPHEVMAVGVLITTLIIGAVIAACYFGLRTVERALSIRELQWSRAIVVEAYTTVQETDWSVPEAGRVVDEFKAVHHNNKVRDGSSLKYVYNFFKDKWEWKSVPKYKDVPVYQTKYTYDIERWVRDRTEIAHGNDQSPHWPEVTLGEHQRRGAESESYTVIFEDTEDHSRSFPRKYDLVEWQKFDKRLLYTGTFDAINQLNQVKPLELERK